MFCDQWLIIWFNNNTDICHCSSVKRRNAGRCHHPGPCWICLVFGHHIFHRSPSLIIHPPCVTSRAFTPCQPRATSSLPPRPLPHHVGSQGRAGGQTCQSKHRRHAAIPQTPITTQQGRGLATAWQPHGPIRVHNNRDQRRPRKVSESVCVCSRVHVWVRRNHVQVIQKPSPRVSVGLTGSHCVFLISVSCVFSEDFQFKGKIYLHLSVDNQGFLLNTHSWIMTGSAGLTNHASMFQKEDESKFDLSMLGRFVPATHYRTIQNGARSHF